MIHILIITIFLVSHTSAATRAYFTPNCTGRLRFSFPYPPLDLCVQIPQAASLYSTDVVDNEFLGAYENPACGRLSCGVNTHTRCCGVNANVLQGVRRSALEENGKTGTAKNPTTVWEIGGYLEVEISDGNYITVPNKTKKSPTKQEIYEALLAAGLSSSDANELADQAYKYLNGQSYATSDNFSYKGIEEL